MHFTRKQCWNLILPDIFPINGYVQIETTNWSCFNRTCNWIFLFDWKRVKTSFTKISKGFAENNLQIVVLFNFFYILQFRFANFTIFLYILSFCWVVQIVCCKCNNSVLQIKNCLQLYDNTFTITRQAYQIGTKVILSITNSLENIQIDLHGYEWMFYYPAVSLNTHVNSSSDSARMLLLNHYINKQSIKKKSFKIMSSISSKSPTVIGSHVLTI